MVHILAHFFCNALPGQVEGDCGARPDLRGNRPPQGGEFRGCPVPGTAVRFQDSFFLKVSKSTGDICFITLAEVGESGSSDFSLIAVKHQKIESVCAPQTIFFHFIRCDLVPVPGNVKNIQTEMLKTVFHYAILSKRGAGARVVIIE